VYTVTLRTYCNTDRPVP